MHRDVQSRCSWNRWEFCLSMRESTNAYVPRDVSRDKRGKFCKHLNRFKIKINNMNEENFAAFFVLLAFMELFLQWQVLLVKPITIKGKQGHSHSRKTERFYELVC